MRKYGRSAGNNYAAPQSEEKAEEHQEDYQNDDAACSKHPYLDNSTDRKGDEEELGIQT